MLHCIYTGVQKCILCVVHIFAEGRAVHQGKDWASILIGRQKGQIRRLKEPHIRNSQSLQRPASAGFSFGEFEQRVYDVDEEYCDDIQQKHISLFS